MLSSRTEDSSPLVGAVKHVYYWAASDFYSREFCNPAHTHHSENDIVIYYIHGTADRTGAFTPAARDLIKDLPENIAKIHLVSFEDRGQGKDIESFSLQLAHKIESENNKNVILIGHSRGGLVAAHFAEYRAPELDINVHSVIGVCSPFRGSDMAIAPLAWGSKSVAQMRKKSAFLEELSEKIRGTCLNYRYFSARNDQIVAVEDVCIPEHRAFSTLIDHHNHLSVLNSPVFTKHLKAHLRTFETLNIDVEPIVRTNTEWLIHLKAALAATDPAGRLHRAGQNVLTQAQKVMPPANQPEASKNWRLSVELASRVLRDPTNETAVSLLALNAKHHAPGSASTWKQLVGALTVLAVVAMVGLSLAGVPLTAGASLTGMYIGDCMLAACGAVLFFQGKQKSLSLAASELVSEARSFSPAKSPPV